MTLEEEKRKVLALIEELNEKSQYLTDDPDIQGKINDVINQVMFELSRYKKLPRYLEMEVSAGDMITFRGIEQRCGNAVYQIASTTGVSHEAKADGTVLKILESGTLGIDFFVYPKRITKETQDKEYVFELTDDVLEIMPYGVAADLLKSDVSAQYGAVYAKRYQELLQMLDPRHKLSGITIEGGVDL